jgi:hypothetical protein
VFSKALQAQREATTKWHGNKASSVHLYCPLAVIGSALPKVQGGGVDQWHSLGPVDGLHKLGLGQGQLVTNC